MARATESRHRGLTHWVLILSVFLTFAVAHVTPAHAAPSARWFWVVAPNGWVRLQCSRLASGTRADLYAPKSVHLSRGAARSIVASFERRIFPTDIRIFGLPAHFGRIAIVLAPLAGSMIGYFDENDLLLKTDPSYDPSHFNGGNVVYVRASGVVRSRQMADVDEALAHELQHLIDYRVRVIDHRFRQEELWLNEGLSFYSQIANGFLSPPDYAKIQAAAQSPSWPVTELKGNIEFLRRHARVAYGRAGLFVSYLASRFGDGFIRNLVSSRLTGMRAVDAALHSVAPPLALPGVFADWGVAVYLDRHGVYGYGTLPAALHQTPRLLVSPVGSYPFDSGTGAHSLSLQSWGHGYMQFVGGKASDLRLDVVGPPGRLAVATVLEDSDGTIPTRVTWMKVGADGHASYRISELGGFYNRVTMVATDLGSLDPGTAATNDPIHVSAVLVHVRNDN